ncbi:MAG: hypothetical protein HN475_09560 [Piscirickettsiaceae bacterium]|nr:hypothetical protein [Piscirickettsiaceae bacterium]
MAGTKDDIEISDGTNWLAIADITVLHPEQEVDVRTKITLDERNGFDRRQTIEGESEKKRQRSEDRRAPENPDTIAVDNFIPY